MVIPGANTPHIDEMASEGINFDRFYVASPVCMPNRLSYDSLNAVKPWGKMSCVPLSHEHVTFVELLRAAGYDNLLQEPFAEYERKIRTVQNARSSVISPRQKSRQLPSAQMTQANIAMSARHSFDRKNPTCRYHITGLIIMTPVTRHGFNTGGNHQLYTQQHAPDAFAMWSRDIQLEHNYSCPQAVRTKNLEAHHSQ